MKKILITGMNGFLGNQIENWLSRSPEKFDVTKISVRDEKWKQYDFSKFDVVIHLAGIAHFSRNKKYKDQYFKINKNLTIEIAKKSIESNVEQFIFFSSIIVYGDKNELINSSTIPQPADFYGQSKLEAEQELRKLQSDSFKVSIVRPPMIYGENPKGNYKKLSYLAKKTFLFPNYRNKRSMIHIDNLCAFIEMIINKPRNQIYFPQNKEYVNTTNLVNEIAKNHGRKIYFIKGFNLLINIAKNKSVTFRKLFGDLVYDKSLSGDFDKYNVHDFEKSIKITEQEVE